LDLLSKVMVKVKNEYKKQFDLSKKELNLLLIDPIIMKEIVNIIL